MKTLNFRTLFLSLFVLIIFNFTVLRFTSTPVFAQTTLSYPIADLGFCRDAKECFLYCEIPEHKAACWSYGKFKLGPNVLGVTTEEEQQMQEKARQLGITFPIAELGNCTSPTECRTYCELPANQTACMNFAKRTGLAKEPDDGMNTNKRTELLESARTELGCTSQESCKSICDNDRAKCEAFARRHGVYQEPPQNPQQQQLMEHARAELGCTSQESCKSTCEQNPQRCMEFANKYGLEQPQNSRQERTEQIPQASQMTPGAIPPQTQMEPRQSGASGYGPADCRTQSECEAYCRNNPTKCPGFGEAQTRPQYQNMQAQPMLPQASPMPQQYQQPSTNYQPPTTNESYTPPPTDASGNTSVTPQ